MYRVFTRTWWRESSNPKWPNGLEPEAGPKSIIETGLSETEAQERCEQYNSTHNPRRLSRKAEYEEQ